MLAETEGRPGLEPIVLAHEPDLRVGPLNVAPAHRRIAHADGRENFLEPKVMQVLVLMIRHRDAVLTRDDLLQGCWQGRIVGEDAITRVVSRLRRVGRGIGAGVFRIETIPKVGYRLVVEPEARAPAPPMDSRLSAPSMAFGAIVMLLVVTLAAFVA